MSADRELRRRLFWWVAAGAALAVAAAHGLERALRYPLLPGQSLAHGSYGLSLATPAPAASATRVLLLGNSVYQHEGLPNLMQHFAELRGRDLALTSYAQVGSGLEDYLVQAAWTANQPRELTVVCLGQVSVSSAGPRLRTDAELLACDPRVLGRLPASFYRRNFAARDLATSACAALLPHQRVDPLLRHALRESAIARPAFLYDRLRFPGLNLGRDRIVDRFLRGQAQTFAWWSDAPLPGWEQALDELLALLRSRGPVLLIRQEARPSPYDDDVLAALSARAAAASDVTLVDLQPAWRPDTYADPIHPTDEERPRQALRHLAAIEQALKLD